MRYVPLAVLPVAILAGLAAGEERDGNRAAGGVPVALPHAGLRLSVPAGFRLVPATRGALLTARRQTPRGRLEGISVVARLRKGATKGKDPRSFAEAYVRGLERSAGLKRTKKYALKACRVAGGQGWRTTLSLSGDTRKVTVAATFWWQRFAKDDITLCYIVSALAPGEDPNRASAVADTVCGSVAHPGLEHPSDCSVSSLLGPVPLKAEGVAVHVPLGWMLFRSGRRPGSNIVFKAGALDYVHDLRVPNVNLTVVQTRATADPNLNDPAVFKRRARLAKRFVEGQPGWSKVTVSKSKLGGRPAVQVVSHMRIRKNKGVQVARQAFRNRKIYTLTLTWDGTDEKRALAAADRIAAGVQFLDQPSTTTAPSTQRAPAR